MAPHQHHNSYASSLSVSTSTMSSSSSSGSSSGSSLFSSFSPLSSSHDLPPSRTSSEQNSPLSTPPPEELLPPPYERHRALLLLSVQRAPLSDPSEGGMPHAARTRSNISRVLAAARAANPPPLIVHVRHEGESGEADERGTAGWELWTDVREGEVVLDKRKTSAWSGTRLGEWIDPAAEVVVVGTASDSCVMQTCRDALRRDNPVMLISGAHCANDRAAMFGGPHGITKSAREVEEEVERELDEMDVSLVDMDMVEDIFNGR